MKNIIIFGGVGNGTVLLNAILDINQQKGKEYNIVGFVNNQSETIKSIEGVPVLGDICDIEQILDKNDAYFINAISSVKTMKLVEKLFSGEYDLSDRMISIIHPNSFIGTNVQIGKGCFVGPQSYIGQNSVIQDHCFIHSQCYIARDSKIGVFNYLAPKVYLGAEVQTDAAVYFGVGAMVRERITVGRNAIIGMGAVIVDNIVSNGKYYGQKATKRN